MTCAQSMPPYICTQAIQQLTKLAPATALLLKRDQDGVVTDEQEVPIALVQRGDILKVRARELSDSCHLKGQLIDAAAIGCT